MRLPRVLALLVVLLASGCYRVQLELPVSGGQIVRERQHFFLLGLVGDAEVDLKETCPNGVTTFGDEFRIGDLLFTVGTLGLYSPKTVVVRCAA